MSFAFNRLSDPGYFRENREDAHSDHSCEGADGEKLQISLNGNWKFFCAANEQQVIPGFEQPDYDCEGWADITVPAHIQMEGFGHPQYCNVQYPWDGAENVDIGRAPALFNPVACYVKTFFVPEEWRSGRVIVSFQGAESCIAVWLNGHYVGFASDTFTPDEFELTPYLLQGENKIACRVYRWNAGSWLEDQDFMRFSGLFRDVLLKYIPSMHLADLKVETQLDSEYRDALLKVRIRTETDGEGTAVFQLTDGDSILAEEILTVKSGEQSVEIPVKHPRKWSSEKPELYTLVIRLTDREGVCMETVRQRIGFRSIEIKNGILLLNGVRIVFKGTNRHDFCAETGRAVGAEKIRRDLLTMKRNNINAIRTSHYPNSSVLYDLCDELGFYVIDECNMETHDIWNRIVWNHGSAEDALPGDRTEYLPMLLDRIHSMVERDKNHHCIVMWSCGNESFGGSVIYEMSRGLKKTDGTRPVHYEGIHWDNRYPATSDVYSQMYTPADMVRSFIESHQDKPFILCEYVHSMGNSNGAMHKYTKMAYEVERYQGGFIWDYIDQSVRTKDRYGHVFYGYGGDFDDRPNDGDFSGNGIVFGDGSETPKMQEIKYNYRPIEAEVSRESILIRNRMMFTSTSEYQCMITLERNGERILRIPMETDVPPLEEKSYPVPFDIPTEKGEYACTVSFLTRTWTPWADPGFETAFGQGVWENTGIVRKKQYTPLRIVHGVHNIGIHGEGFHILYSTEHGKLISYQAGGREMLKTAPAPCFWRAPTNNDRGNGMPARYSAWKIADLYADPMLTEELRKLNTACTPECNEDGSVSIRSWWGWPSTPQGRCEIIYTFYPSGAVDMHMRYRAEKEAGDMPVFGLQWKTDADYEHIRYYGYGPQENYCDRKEGARLGIWETTSEANLSRYLRPQECGNRTGVRWATVTDYKGRGIRVSGNGIEFCALPYTSHELENAAHSNELPERHYTVIRAALAQMGVGGDDSWGARTHPEYLIDTRKELEFKLTLEPVYV